MYPSGWGNGSTPGGYSFNQFTNNVTNPCVSATLNSIINGAARSILIQAINDTFGAGGDYDITFDGLPATSMPGTNFLGYFNTTKSHFAGSVDNPYMTGTAVIELNIDTLSAASKELQTAVILHECLHVILASRGLNSFAQHEIMAEVYTNQIADAIQALYPGTSASDAAALAWTGLQMTYQWNTWEIRSFAPAAVKTVIANHLKGLAGTKC